MQNIAFFYFCSNGEIKTNCIQNIHRISSSDKNRNANFCKKLFICMYCKIGFTSVRFLDLPQKFSILHHIFYLIIVLCIHASSFVWNKNMNGIFCLWLVSPFGTPLRQKNEGICQKLHSL